ncbi:MAG TPA: ATP-dependent RNA helicase, partial [Hyphomonas sp.]|nr:ATP-dependent RNA helicase [Hyphomonas sp.]
GVSALLVAPRARRRVERLLRDAKIEASWGKPPSADEINALDDARLMADPIFTEDSSANEAELARTLIDTYGAEQVAAAFVRRHRAGRTAPEDLRDVDDRAPSRDRNERGDRRDRDDRPPREKRERQDRKG